MNEISSWLLSMGISPLLGGLIAGAVVVFLLMRRSGDRGAPVLGVSTGLEPAGGPSIRTRSLTAGRTQVRIEQNGRPVELSPEASAELPDHLRHGRKIDAIKCVRGASGLDLVDAKQLVEALEKSGMAR